MQGAGANMSSGARMHYQAQASRSGRMRGGDAAERQVTECHNTAAAQHQIWALADGKRRGSCGRRSVILPPAYVEPFVQLRSNGRRYSHTEFKNKEGSHAC